MNITNRLSMFFLAALAIVLVGFSGTLYVLARWHLYAELDEELNATIHVLVASIEVHPGDVEWEPLERDVPLGRGEALDQVRWMIHDEQGKIVDHSANLADAAAVRSLEDRSIWRVVQSRLIAGQFQPNRLVGEYSLPFADSVAKLPSNRTSHRKWFVLTAAIAEGPVRATLTQLALTMLIVSLVIWVFAAAVGRWLCRRALSPVLTMAHKARELRELPEKRELLDVPDTGDEFADLACAFNELLTTLHENIEQQRRFAGDASHQLRTPLAALLAATDVAVRQPRGEEEYRHVLSVVQRRGRDLQKIVETLLMLTRREFPEHLAPEETIELDAWCQERMEFWREHERAADIHFEPSTRPIHARARDLLLGQVFDNLLDNACKYSEKGTPVSVRVTSAPEEVSIHITDQGTGLTSEELTQVFEPFFRSDQARWSGVSGVGLGLTIARRLITWQGGRLEVTSQRGAGSTFTIVLPASGGATAIGQDSQAISDLANFDGDSKNAVRAYNDQANSTRLD